MDHAAVDQQQVTRLCVIGGLSDQKPWGPLIDQQYLRKLRMGVEQPGAGLLNGRAAADVQQPGHGVLGEGRLVLPLDKALNLGVLHIGLLSNETVGKRKNL